MEGRLVKYKVCHQSEIEERQPFTSEINGKTIGIIRANNQYYAYENACPHFGGPVCLGGVFGKISLELDAEKKVKREVVSEESFNLVCPWHGFEFDLDTGECVFDDQYKLRKYSVDVQDGIVVVEVK